MEGWVDLSDWLHTELVYPPSDGHTSKYYNPAAHDQESNSRPVDHKSDALTTTPASYFFVLAEELKF